MSYFVFFHPFLQLYTPALLSFLASVEMVSQTTYIITNVNPYAMLTTWSDVFECLVAPTTIIRRFFKQQVRGARSLN